MAKKMTISDAVEVFDLYDLYEEIIDAYEADFYTRSEMEADLRDLIEEHDEIYEFSADEDDGYSESFERNLKEAISMIFDDHGLDLDLDDQFMDEDDIDVYDDEPLVGTPGRDEDEEAFGEDEDEMF